MNIFTKNELQLIKFAVEDLLTSSREGIQRYFEKNNIQGDTLTLTGLNEKITNLIKNEQ